MAVNDPIQQARARLGAANSLVLSSDRSTGEKPWEMFVTDEHTEHYLALKAGGNSDRGMMAGILGGTLSLVGLLMSALLVLNGKIEGVWIGLALSVAFFAVPFLWETRRPLPLPILFNRRTREVYFDHDGELFHTPWDGIQALAGEFTLVGPHTGAMRNASLEILVRRLGEPKNALLVRLGLPMGKTLQMQKGFWEWLRAYMNNGPWFDENGQHSDSDVYVKEMIKAGQVKSTDWHKHTLAQIAEKKAANGGRNYLEWTDAFSLMAEIMFYPAHWLQEFTYNVAKRRSRNRWPNIVLERLRPDGPTSRLIDLERERGLDV